MSKGKKPSATRCGSITSFFSKKTRVGMSTTQCLAECHEFLASLTVMRLKEALVDQSTGYALELRRGECRLHIIQTMFKDGITKIYSYPESDAIGKIKSSVNSIYVCDICLIGCSVRSFVASSSDEVPLHLSHVQNMVI